MSERHKSTDPEKGKMSEVHDLPGDINEGDLILGRTLRVINSLESNGVIGQVCNWWRSGIVVLCRTILH